MVGDSGRSYRSRAGKVGAHPALTACARGAHRARWELADVEVVVDAVANPDEDEDDDYDDDDYE